MFINVCPTEVLLRTGLSGGRLEDSSSPFVSLSRFKAVSPSCRRAIRAAFKNRQRGAVLTTHYMEEAEAVCDRVAIMVSGQLRLALAVFCFVFPVGTGVRIAKRWLALFFLRQIHRLHPASEREVRSRLQPGGEAQRGADGAPAGGAVAQRGPQNLPTRCAAREVRPSDCVSCLVTLKPGKPNVECFLCHQDKRSMSCMITRPNDG